MDYIGLVSEVSDVMHQAQNDADAYVKIAKKYSGKILELGSGSGCLSLELAKEGYDVTCLEIHRDMIHLHQEKLTEVTEDHTTIVLGDMCSFDLGERFDLVIAPDNVIQYIKTVEDFMDMLQSVKRHLTDVGVFVMEGLQPDETMMLKRHGVQTTQQFISMRNNNPIEERVTFYYDPKTKMEVQKKVINEYENRRIKRRVEFRSEHKCWQLQDVRNMIKAAQMSIILESGALPEIEPITEDSSRMVFYIKK